VAGCRQLRRRMPPAAVATNPADPLDGEWRPAVRSQWV